MYVLNPPSGYSDTSSSILRPTYLLHPLGDSYLGNPSIFDIQYLKYFHPFSVPPPCLNPGAGRPGYSGSSNKNMTLIRPPDIPTMNWAFLWRLREENPTEVQLRVLPSRVHP
jgi:hypothetical protein